MHAIHVALGIAGGAILVAVLVELAIRLSRVLDVPLYSADSRLGYVALPNQSGRWLLRNKWVLNDRSMGTTNEFAFAPTDILLLGDSIVFGGIRFTHSATLGPQLGSLVDRKVWPLSAPSWALENELEAYRDVAATTSIGTLVLISNTADLGRPSVWQSEFTHPTHIPRLTSLYLFRKYRRLIKVRTSPAKPEAARDAASIGKELLDKAVVFAANFPGRLIWVLYPKRGELADEPASFAKLRDAIGNRAEFVMPSLEPEWAASLYRDGIHPTEEGVRLLAELIAEQVLASDVK